MEARTIRIFWRNQRMGWLNFNWNGVITPQSVIHVSARWLIFSILVFIASGSLHPNAARAATQPATGDSLKSDFNGDGYDDLAIGIPGETVSGVEHAGAVQVLYGGPDGLLTKEQLWHRASPTVPGDLMPDERWGSVVTAGNFDGDAYADLAVAARSTSLEGHLNLGSVVVLHGSGAGLVADENSETFGPLVSDNAFFGAALAAGDFNNDGLDDLAVGSPGSNRDIGQVAVLSGSEDGLGAGFGGVTVLRKSQIPFPPGMGKEGDLFGTALASGDFNRDGFDDLAVGAPGNISTNDDEGGRVFEVLGSPDGLDPEASDSFTQNSDFVSGVSEAGDLWGANLVAADFDGNGSSDLAIGIPFEDHEGADPIAVNAGAVAVLYGFTGLSTVNNQLWHQDVQDFSGQAETGDLFGTQLAVGDFDGNGYFDLAIGVPREDFAGFEDAGVIHVLYGSDDGLSIDREELWNHDSPGIARGVEESETFGASLGAGDFNGDGFHDLAIGIPNESYAGAADAGGVTILYGGSEGLRVADNQFWYQDSPGVPGGAEEGDKFGSSLSGGAGDIWFPGEI